MPALTPSGISYPTPTDIHPSAAWWSALAVTTDNAVTASQDSTKAWSTSKISDAQTELRDYVDGAILNSVLGGATQAQIDAAVTRVLSSQAWKDRQSRVALVTDFGAKGDGVTDDTAAIQAALDNAAQAPVHFAKKTYVVSAALRIPSGAILIGNGATLKPKSSITSLFTIRGTAEQVEVSTTGTYNAGDSVFTTAVPHGFQVGETIRIVGQRQIASVDAPYEDRLGMATGNSGGPWNGEYLTIKEILSATKFKTLTGVIFNAYRADKFQETHPQSRTRTTVNRMYWHQGARIEGFRIEGDIGTTISADYAKDLMIRDVHEVRARDNGALVSFTGCYRCTVTESESAYVGPPSSSVALYQRPVFRMISSQACVVDRCKSDGGNQVVDQTYHQTYKIPTIACVVRDCEFSGYANNGVTTHPGCWGSIIMNNDFRGGDPDPNGDRSSGIGVRSPYSLVVNNMLAGVPRSAMTGPSITWPANYGINLYDGGGHHSMITGNWVRGYDLGVTVTDGNEAAERHGDLYLMIEGNYVLDTYYGIILRKSGYGDGSVWSAVSIAGNYIASKYDNAVGIQTDQNDGSNRAPVLTGNRMHFTGTTPVPVRLGKMTKNPVLVSNTVTGTASSLYETQSGAANGTIALAGNVVINASGVTLYPPPGTGGGGGSVKVVPDPSVAGAYLIGD